MEAGKPKMKTLRELVSGSGDDPFSIDNVFSLDNHKIKGVWALYSYIHNNTSPFLNLSYHIAKSLPYLCMAPGMNPSGVVWG